MMTMPVAVEFLRWCGGGSADAVMKRNAMIAQWAGSVFVYVLKTKTFVAR